MPPSHVHALQRAPAVSVPALLGAALLALLLVRMAGLHFAQTDLFVDEAQYWSWSRDLAFGYFSKPPLVAWIIRATTSVCGDGEACIRVAAPLFYTATAGVIYLCGKALYGTRVGAAGALLLAAAPGASFSSGQISTDVPLLFFWSLGLLAWAKLIETRQLRWALLLGIALGLGLMAKYAMLYFLVGLAAHATVSRWARIALRPLPLLVAALTAGAIVAPHLVWLAQNGFVTLAHTADNANWSGHLGHFDEFLEFLGSQFAVFGPTTFAAFLLAVWMTARRRTSEAERFLLAFSLPVLAIVLVQAFISRAHANWAATAYPAAAILVAAVLVEQNWRRLLAASFGIGAAFAVIFPLALAAAPQIRTPDGLDPFARQLGWRELAAITRAEAARHPYAAILTQNRWVSAELLYYLRDLPLPLVEYRPPGPPENHFQMTRPFRPVDGPLLLVTTGNRPVALAEQFSSVVPILADSVTAGAVQDRTVRLFRVQGYRGPGG